MPVSTSASPPPALLSVDLTPHVIDEEPEARKVEVQVLVAELVYRLVKA